MRKPPREGSCGETLQLREVFEPTYCKCRDWPRFVFILLQKYTVSLLEEHAFILYIIYDEQKCMLNCFLNRESNWTGANDKDCV